MTYKVLHTSKSDLHTKKISVWGKKLPKNPNKTKKPTHKNHTLEQMLKLADALLGT